MQFIVFFKYPVAFYYLRLGYSGTVLAIARRVIEESKRFVDCCCYVVADVYCCYSVFYISILFSTASVTARTIYSRRGQTKKDVTFHYVAGFFCQHTYDQYQSPNDNCRTDPRQSSRIDRIVYLNTIISISYLYTESSIYSQFDRHFSIPTF